MMYLVENSGHVTEYKIQNKLQKTKYIKPRWTFLFQNVQLS